MSANIQKGTSLSFHSSKTVSEAEKINDNGIYFAYDGTPYGTIIVNGKKFGTSNSDYLSEPKSGGLYDFINSQDTNVFNQAKNYTDGIISDLNAPDTAMQGKYVSSVSQTYGQIYVTHSDFPNITSLGGITPTGVDTKISNAIGALNSSPIGKSITVYTYTNGVVSNYSSTPQIKETAGKLTSLTVLSQATNLVTKEYVDHMHNVLLGDGRLVETVDTIKEISYWLDNDLNDGKNLTLSLAQLTSKVSYNEKVETTAISNIIDGTIKIKAAESADSLSNISIGNSNTPTYFSNGVPVAMTKPISNALISKTTGQSTLQWDTEITLATIAGTAIKAKLPANPNTDTDTKNTAGSNNTNSKIYLIGATSQTGFSQTFSHDTAYVGTDGCLYSYNHKVITTYEFNPYKSEVDKSFQNLENALTWK